MLTGFMAMDLEALALRVARGEEGGGDPDMVPQEREELYIIFRLRRLALFSILSGYIYLL